MSKNSTQPSENQEEVLLWDPPSLAEFLDMKFDPPSWIVHDFVPEDALVLVSGQAKRAYKTFFSDVLALAVATGKEIGAVKPIKSGPVIIVEEEGSYAETQNRMKALCTTHDIDYKELTNIKYIFRNRVRLDDVSWTTRLEALARRINPTLVVLDPISYMYSGDENKANDMEPVFYFLQGLRNEAGCTIMYLMHLDKTNGENPKKDIDMQVRGSGKFTQSYDMHIGLRHYNMNDRYIQCTLRSRSGPEQYYLMEWEILSKPKDPETGFREIISVTLKTRQVDEHGGR